MSKQRYADWFRALTGHAPRPWQAALAERSACEDLQLRIPTGFGKTLGVLAAWAWNRLVLGNQTWPRRLVWCLPMRVLVEQTVDVAQKALAAVSASSPGIPTPSVVALLGGADAGAWHLAPEAPAVLVGTQDMLLSRALNRGYGSGRARWPIDYGLLNQDALWVLDEVQLMDVGLCTSAQLQAFRQTLAPRALRPARSWWMSATLQPAWLESVDTSALLRATAKISIPAEAQTGALWDDVTKPLAVKEAAPEAWPELVAEQVLVHGKGKLTLVVVNTVRRAIDLHGKLRKALQGHVAPEEVRLVHSRFRPHERKQWREAFLNRDSVPAGGRVVVATQVVEAGVDLDACLLVSELAPWSSLVQRFGRAARGGGNARVVVLDPRLEDKKARPYEPRDLEGSRQALLQLSDVSPLAIERFERDLLAAEVAGPAAEGSTTAAPLTVSSLYPKASHPLLLEREWHELFDTTPDLTGADLDISRFIRSGDERDVQVFWDPVAEKAMPSPRAQPSRESLCSVPFLDAREWLCGKTGERLAAGKRAWVWDYLQGEWVVCSRSKIAPGRTLLVAADCGGYSVDTGWDPRSHNAVALVPPPVLSAQEQADAAQDVEELSHYAWKTIATHGHEAAVEVRKIGEGLGFVAELCDDLHRAARWHDLGKSHPAFQGWITSAARPDRTDLAKAPSDAWPARARYRMAGGETREGFRHELASALALFAVLQRHQPLHAALLGPWQEMLATLGPLPALASTAARPPTAEEQELLGLDAARFDRTAFLVLSHHGKVRASLHAAPADQEYVDRDGHGLPIRGVREGDLLPEVVLSPGGVPLPQSRLTLEPAVAGLSASTGRSWTERVQGLLRIHGPTSLALMEACLRAADVKASQLVTADALLTGEKP